MTTTQHLTITDVHAALTEVIGDGPATLMIDLIRRTVIDFEMTSQSLAQAVTEVQRQAARALDLIEDTGVARSGNIFVQYVDDANRLNAEAHGHRNALAQHRLMIRGLTGVAITLEQLVAVFS